MAGKKAAATSKPDVAAAAEVPMRDEPTIDALLEKQREANRRDLDGVGEVIRDEPTIDPALVKAREEESKQAPRVIGGIK